MGTPLTGKTPANTYDALIKIGDNSPLTSNLKVLSDGLGNDLPLTVSSTAITITGNATFSANVDATSAVLTVATQSANDNSTKAASTAYVDNSSGNADLDFGGDNASTGNVLLNTQTFQVSGTANEIVTAASNQSLTFSLDSSGVNLPDNSTAVTQTAGDSSTKIATTAFVSSESLAQDLDFSGDTGTGAVILNTETFAVTGTTNQIETTASGTGLALSLPSTVHRNLQGNVTGNLTGDVTGDLTGNVTATSVLADGVTATTQALADDTTKVATTAFVQDVVGTIPAGLVFQGTWNADTNTPTLASGTGTTGHFYIVSVAGTTDLDGVTDWAVGDWAVFVEQGATDQWEKVDNSSVLDGNGTGGKISKWAGSGNSVTLTDSVMTELSSKIGIGVSNPTSTLEVEGDVRVKSGNKLILNRPNNAVTSELSTNASGTLILNSLNAEGIDVQNNGTSSLKVDSAGNVGIGVSSGMTYPLTIQAGSGNNSYVHFVNTTTGTAFNDGFQVGVADGSSDGYLLLRESANMRFYTAGSQKMNISSAGALQLNTYGAGTLVSDASGNITSISGGGEGGPYLPLAGGTITGLTNITSNLTFGNGNELRFGSSNEFGMFFSSGTSNIRINSGILAIRADDLRLTNQANNEFYLKGIANGAVELYYDNSKKFETTSSGVEVAGARSNTAGVVSLGLNASDSTIHYGFRLDQTNNAFNIDRVDSALNLMNLSTSGNATFAGDVTVGALTSGATAQLVVNHEGGSTPVASFKARTNRAQVLVADNDTTGYLVSEGSVFGIGRTGSLSANNINIDSSNNVGIGTTAPSSKLQIGLNGSLGAVTNKNINATFDGGYSTSNSLQYQVNSHVGTTTDTSDIFTQTSGESLKNFYEGIVADGGYFNANRYSIIQGGAERFTIKQGGNVGIGTTSPSATLEINSDTANAAKLKIGRQVGLSNYLELGTIGGSSVINAIGIAGTNGSLIFNRSTTTTTTESMRIDGSGNVGIGTSSPNETLSLYKSDRPYIQFTSNTTGTTSSDGSFIGFANADGFLEIRNKEAQPIRLSTSDTERMRITSDGKVGIGTASPYGTLNVIPSSNPTSATAANQISIGESSANSTYNLRLGYFLEGGAYKGSIQSIAGDTPSTLVLNGDGGNVGIGTSAPTRQLQINNSAAAATSLRLTNGAASISTGGDFGLSSGGDLAVWHNDNLGILFGTNNTEAMRIDSASSVLIGTTTEGTTHAYFARESNDRSVLSLGSSTTSNSTIAAFKNPNGTVGSISTNGSATAFNTSSDYRLKENVVEMTGALDRVAQLKPSRFNFIADSDKVVDGFLAHEVQSVVPEAITGTKDGMKDEEYEKTPAVYEDKVHPAIEEEKDEEGNVITEAKESWTEKVLVSEAVMDTRSVPDYQGIDQSKLVPLLVGAIQELKAEIELLKAK